MNLACSFMNILSRAWPRLSSQQEKQPALGSQSPSSLRFSSYYSSSSSSSSSFLSFIFHVCTVLACLRPFFYVRHRPLLSHPLYRRTRVSVSSACSLRSFAVSHLNMPPNFVCLSFAHLASLYLTFSALSVVSFVLQLLYVSIFLVSSSVSL